MILKPQKQDFKIIGHFLGRVILSFGIMMALPIGVAVWFGEAAPVVDLSISFLFSVLIGLALTEYLPLPKNTEMSWSHGMVVVSGAWIICMFLGAIPLYLSGHWASYLDACFEAMSGLATTGLVLVQDLDHLSKGVNFWRHLLMFLGGQGIIVVALSFLVKGGPGAFRLYVGEARDEKILPNIVETSRFIWLVSLVYFVLGTLLLTACGYWAVGLGLKDAFFHGACNFMAGFDTGGFSPQSQNILFYQSVPYEILTLIIIVWGALNFNIHYAIWSGKRKELFGDLETRTFFVTLTIVVFLVIAGLARCGAYPAVAGLIRKGVYQAVSAHTGTGFSTIYVQQFVGEWGGLALIGLILAMGLGSSVCSTTGGIKMLRVGLIAKAFREDVKRFLSSESAVLTTRFHHVRNLFLDDKLVRSAALITLAYIILYLLGAIIGSFFGYPFLESLFESTSAAANVGLSCGITTPQMPNALKVIYILQMWTGRLEFISVLVLGGFLVSLVRGK